MVVAETSYLKCPILSTAWYYATYNSMVAVHSLSIYSMKWQSFVINKKNIHKNHCYIRNHTQIHLRYNAYFKKFCVVAHFYVIKTQRYLLMLRHVGYCFHKFVNELSFINNKISFCVEVIGGIFTNQWPF